MTVHDRTRLIGSTRRYNKYCICATKTTCTGHLSSIEEKIPKKDEVFFGKEERQTEKRAARETSGERNLPCRDETEHDRTRLIGSTRRYNKYCMCAAKTTCTGHLSSIEEKIPKKDEVFFGKEERQTEKRAARETSGERNCLVATRPSTTEPGLSVRLGLYCVYEICFKSRNLFP